MTFLFAGRLRAGAGDQINKVLKSKNRQQFGFPRTPKSGQKLVLISGAIFCLKSGQNGPVFGLYTSLDRLILIILYSLVLKTELSWVRFSAEFGFRMFGFRHST